jgi:hypothetical protein
MIAIAIFAMLGVAAYNLEVASTKALRAYREKEDVAALADQYIEIARNLPYSEIGTLSGNPHGVLPDQPNELNLTYDNTKYELYYVVNYVNDPAASTTDSGDEDYKQVKIFIQNPQDGLLVPFETDIVPNGIGGVSGGALSLQVINADGVPVPDAQVTITNNSVSPAINVTRTTNSAGDWVEVGLPNSVNSYHIVATKSGYSTDQTYASSQSNPNPTKPDATIANGQVTAVSFAIDQESSLTVNTVNQACQPISGVGLQLEGTKLIGTSPNVYKFDNTYTSNSSGQVVLNPIEWDTYTPSITSASYMIYGSSPIQQINLLPAEAQQSTLVLGPTTRIACSSSSKILRREIRYRARRSNSRARRHRMTTRNSRRVASSIKTTGRAAQGNTISRRAPNIIRTTATSTLNRSRQAYGCAMSQGRTLLQVRSRLRVSTPALHQLRTQRFSGIRLRKRHRPPSHSKSRRITTTRRGTLSAPTVPHPRITRRRVRRSTRHKATSAICVT